MGEREIGGEAERKAHTDLGLYALQHTATHRNTLQNTAMHCNALQCTATRYYALQHTATCCNTHCNILQHATILQHSTTHCKTLQHSASSKATRLILRRNKSNINHAGHSLLQEGMTSDVRRILFVNVRRMSFTNGQGICVCLPFPMDSHSISIGGKSPESWFSSQNDISYLRVFIEKLRTRQPSRDSCKNDGERLVLSAQNLGLIADPIPSKLSEKRMHHSSFSQDVRPGEWPI